MSSVGGLLGTDYYAQSFKALSDYLVDGALWIQNNSGMTPNFRLMLCNNTDLGFPNIANPMFISQAISNVTINARPGRFYLNLTTPMRVQQNRTYWLVIDGYYDNKTSGTGRSRWQYGNPYKDGGFLFSNTAGASWSNPYFATYDLNFIVNFSNRPTKAEVFGKDWVTSVGGTTGSDYYAQSFKALDSYIVDAGISIENGSNVTPNYKVEIWGNNATGGDHPNKSNVLASSRLISGAEINKTDGQRFFVHPNVSISVVPGEKYWLVIDGTVGNTTIGYCGSRGINTDTFPDGQFMYCNDYAGKTWSTWPTKDLSFVVNFSASRSAIKMMKGDSYWGGIGGNGINNLIGQSFKALNKYILDAGIWLQNASNNTPTVRILICPSTLANASQPDLANYVARSIPITGQQISSTPGMQYLRPTKPIEVVPGQTYFFIVDGYSIGNATAGSLITYDRYVLPNGPYTDGMEMYSRNAGATWGTYTSYDLGLDVAFSDVPYEAQCGENSIVATVGGTGSDYYAQSFVALNDYISEAGIWIGPNSGITPNLRLLLCRNGANHPNLTDIMAQSLVISGSVINATAGFFYVKPPTPIPVTIGGTYWIVIDGYYDHVTAGAARSQCMVNSDVYTDGEFQYSNNAGVSWTTPSITKDLEFSVTFTHVNQPPTQPIVTISPLKPLDKDDLTVLWPIPSTDFEMEPITYYIEWYLNGVVQPAWSNSAVLPHGTTLPTDNWMVRVTPYDGHINGTTATYTVHVQADILTLDHPITAFSQPFHVITTSNTTITAFNFNQTTGKITFTSTGPLDTKGFCNITIPRTLIIEPWIIKVNGVQVFPATPDNGTHTFIALNYSTSSVPIEIQGLVVVPEFAPALLLATLATITLVVAVVSRKVNKKKR